MIAESPGLPMWGFLRREGITQDEAANMVNARLFGDFGMAVDQARA